MTAEDRSDLYTHFVCASCRAELPSGGGGKFECGRCGYGYQWTSNGLAYDPDPMLFRDFRKEYLLYKVLSNNGEVAYRVLREDSLATSGRDDVAAFRDYLQSRVAVGRILDIGCGTLPLPGYVDFAVRGDYQLFGLDPLPAADYRGIRVNGACEFLPFRDDYFSALVFATSLDHVCSLTKTAAESTRVLRPGGRLMVWMGDRSQTVRQRIRAWAATRVRNLRRGYRTDRFTVYPNLSVFYVPDGAVDPFHSFPETPRVIERVMRGAGLRHVDTTPVNFGRGPNAFLTFEKAA